MNQPVQPTKIDEKAQLVFSGPQMQVILRYKSVKKAKDHFKLVQGTWAKFLAGKHNGLILLESDMYDGFLDLSKFATAGFVDINKRNNFVPYQ